MNRRNTFVIIAAVVLVLIGGLVVLVGGGGGDGDRDASGPAAGGPDEGGSGGSGGRSGRTGREVPGEAGAAGAGDDYYPQLGNGGYDVDHYDLALSWLPDVGPGISGTVTIEAEATQALSSFNVDLLADLEVDEVSVDGTDATAERRDDHEVTITPAETIAEGDDFTTVLRYGGVSQPVDGLMPGLGGWVPDGREVYVASEPDGAAGFFPVNDHPSDKATYAIHVTAPDDLTVVANGARVRIRKPDVVLDPPVEHAAVILERRRPA